MIFSPELSWLEQYQGRAALDKIIFFTTCTFLLTLSFVSQRVMQMSQKAASHYGEVIKHRQSDFIALFADNCINSSHSSWTLVRWLSVAGQLFVIMMIQIFIIIVFCYDTVYVWIITYILFLLLFWIEKYFASSLSECWWLADYKAVFPDWLLVGADRAT